MFAATTAFTTSGSAEPAENQSTDIGGSDVVDHSMLVSRRARTDCATAGSNQWLTDIGAICNRGMRPHRSQISQGQVSPPHPHASTHFWASIISLNVTIIIRKLRFQWMKSR